MARTKTDPVDDIVAARKKVVKRLQLVCSALIDAQLNVAKYRIIRNDRIFQASKVMSNSEIADVVGISRAYVRRCIEGEGNPNKGGRK